ncbi:hypothetical protein ACJQWK_10063 [Exserohilum turcicum]
MGHSSSQRLALVDAGQARRLCTSAYTCLQASSSECRVLGQVLDSFGAQSDHTLKLQQRQVSRLRSVQFASDDVRLAHRSIHARISKNRPLASLSVHRDNVPIRRHRVPTCSPSVFSATPSMFLQA